MVQRPETFCLEHITDSTVDDMADEDRKHLEEILRLLSQTEVWAARISAGADRLRGAPDSPMGGDDAKTLPI